MDDSIEQLSGDQTLHSMATDGRVAGVVGFGNDSARNLCHPRMEGRTRNGGEIAKQCNAAEI